MNDENTGNDNIKFFEDPEIAYFNRGIIINFGNDIKVPLGTEEAKGLALLLNEYVVLAEKQDAYKDFPDILTAVKAKKQGSNDPGEAA